MQKPGRRPINRYEPTTSAIDARLPVKPLSIRHVFLAFAKFQSLISHQTVLQRLQQLNKTINRRRFECIECLGLYISTTHLKTVLKSMSITNSWKMLFQLKGITPGGAFFLLSHRLAKNSRHPVEDSQAPIKKPPGSNGAFFVSIRSVIPRPPPFPCTPRRSHRRAAQPGVSMTVPSVM